MTLFALGLVLASGFLHAARNLLAKRAGVAGGVIGGERVGHPWSALYAQDGDSARRVLPFLAEGLRGGNLSIVYTPAREIGILIGTLPGGVLLAEGGPGRRLAVSLCIGALAVGRGIAGPVCSRGDGAYAGGGRVEGNGGGGKPQR